MTDHRPGLAGIFEIERGGFLTIYALVAAAYLTSLLTQPDLIALDRLIPFTIGMAVFTLLADLTARYDGPPWLSAVLMVGQSLAVLALTPLSNFAFIMPMLSFITVSQSQLEFPQRLANAFDAALLAAIMLVYFVSGGWSAALQAGLGYGAGYIFIIVFTRLAQREREARQQVESLLRDLEQANAKLAEHAAQVEQLATMRERNRLARDVHDSLGHYLTVINVQLEIVSKLIDSDPAHARDAAVKAKALASEGLAEVRRSVAALRPSPLDDRPLPDAIRSLADAARETGLLASFEQDGAARPLSAEIETTLYRSAQEALTNIRKHAHASRASLRLAYGADAICLRVRDNGVGRTGNRDSIGLQALRERASALNGSVVAENHPEGGYLLEVTLPYGASPHG